MKSKQGPQIASLTTPATESFRDNTTSQLTRYIRHIEQLHRGTSQGGKRGGQMPLTFGGETGSVVGVLFCCPESSVGIAPRRNLLQPVPSHKRRFAPKGFGGSQSGWLTRSLGIMQHKLGCLPDALGPQVLYWTCHGPQGQSAALFVSSAGCRTICPRSLSEAFAWRRRGRSGPRVGKLRFCEVEYQAFPGRLFPRLRIGGWSGPGSQHRRGSIHVWTQED